MPQKRRVCVEERLLSKVRQTIGRFQMVAPGDRILVGVSGGPDSVALLHLLYTISEEINLSLAVVHLDHRLRDDSFSEAAFVTRVVRDLASSRGGRASPVASIPFFPISFDVGRYAEKKKMSLEEAGRRIRYHFFYRVATLWKASRIALGHTRDDCIETLLMNLLRGAGFSGVSGIPPVRGKVIRPLWEISRKEILELLHEKGHDFLSDPSNLSRDFLRNRIRLDLLPLLEQLNPQVREHLLAFSGLAREVQELLSCSARSFLNEHGVLEGREIQGAWERGEESSISIPLPPFSSLSRPLQRQVLREAVTLLKGDLEGFRLCHMEEILALLQKRTGKLCTVPGEVQVRKGYGRLTLTHKGSGLQDSFSTGSQEVAIIVPGETFLDFWNLRIDARIFQASEIPDLPSLLASCPGTEAYLDYKATGSSLLVRGRKPGDFFVPLGFKGKKKLQDFFVDLKVDSSLRGAIPLLVSPSEIVWIMGYRADDRFKVTEKTQTILHVRLMGRGK